MGQSNSTEAKPVGEEQASGVSLAPELEGAKFHEFTT